MVNPQMEQNGSTNGLKRLLLISEFRKHFSAGSTIVFWVLEIHFTQIILIR